MIKEDNSPPQIQVKNNIRYVVFYTMAVSIALGINELFKKIFSKFKIKNEIIANVIYVFLLFGLTIGLVFLLGYTG